VDWVGDDHVTIQIEEDGISPIQAAQFLGAGLRMAMGHYSVESVIVQHEDIEALIEAYEASVEEAARVAAFAANIYLSGISIVNEGFDFVMTVNEVAGGNYTAAIGFLPFISHSMVEGAAIIIRTAAGAEVLRIGKQAADVLRQAADIAEPAARYAHIEEHLTFAQRLELVKGRFLYFKRTDYKQRLIDAGFPKPAHFKNAQVHHDLSQASDLVDKFHAVGLRAFFRTNENPTQAEVLNKMNDLRSNQIYK
jgi:hypothetical protein